MTNVYVKIGLDMNDIQIISSAWTADTQSQFILDDSVVDFSKVNGYVGYVGDDGENHLKFDQDKYNSYLEEVRKQEEAEKRRKELEEAEKALIESVTIEYKKADKAGYKLKCYKIGDTVFKEIYVKDDEVIMNDGSDYTKPITYKDGMSVEKGLWYTDGSDVWECIKEGQPTSFSDKEYFDIIE